MVELKTEIADTNKVDTLRKEKDIINKGKSEELLGALKSIIDKYLYNLQISGLHKFFVYDLVTFLRNEEIDFSIAFNNLTSQSTLGGSEYNNLKSELKRIRDGLQEIIGKKGGYNYPYGIHHICKNTINDISTVLGVNAKSSSRGSNVNKE